MSADYSKLLKKISQVNGGTKAKIPILLRDLDNWEVDYYQTVLILASLLSLLAFNVRIFKKFAILQTRLISKLLLIFEKNPVSPIETTKDTE